MTSVQSKTIDFHYSTRLVNLKNISIFSKNTDGIVIDYIVHEFEIAS